MRATSTRRRTRTSSGSTSSRAGVRAGPDSFTCTVGGELGRERSHVRVVARVSVGEEVLELPGVCHEVVVLAERLRRLVVRVVLGVLVLPRAYGRPRLDPWSCVPLPSTRAGSGRGCPARGGSARRAEAWSDLERHRRLRAPSGRCRRFLSGAGRGSLPANAAASARRTAPAPTACTGGASDRLFAVPAELVVGPQVTVVREIEGQGVPQLAQAVQPLEDAANHVVDRHQRSQLVPPHSPTLCEREVDVAEGRRLVGAILLEHRWVPGPARHRSVRVARVGDPGVVGSVEVRHTRAKALSRPSPRSGEGSGARTSLAPGSYSRGRTRWCRSR